MKAKKLLKLLKTKDEVHLLSDKDLGDLVYATILFKTKDDSAEEIIAHEVCKRLWQSEVSE